MAITVEGVGAQVSSANSSPLTPGYNGITVNAADLILIPCRGKNNSNAFSASGFTSLFGGIEGPSGVKADILYKWAAGGESGTVSVANATATNGWSCNIVIIRGLVGSGDPNDVAPSFGSGTASTMVGESITPTTDGCAILGYWWSGDDNNHGNNSAGTLVFGGTSYHTTDGTDHAASMNIQIQATAGSIGTGTMDQQSNGADAYGRAAIALKPAAGGPTTFFITPSGGITPTGALQKETRKSFAAAVAPTGALLKRIDKRMTASITPAGTLTKSRVAVKSFSGSIAPTGALIKQPRKALAGSVTPAGALIKQPRRSLAGSLTPTGAVALLAVKTRSFAGSILPTGALTRQPNKLLAGALTPTGALTKQPRRSFAGALAPTGALLKQVRKTFTASFTPTGSLANIALKNIVLAGTLSTSGALTKQAQKRFTGAFAPTGSLLKQLQRRLTGSLTTAGTVTFLAVKTLALGGTFAPVGTLTKQVRKTLTATLAPTGALLKMPARRFTGSLATAGALTNVKSIPPLFLAGTLTTAGSLRRAVSKAFTASIGPIGTLTKRVSHVFGGVLSFVGSLANVIIGPPAGSIAVLEELRVVLAAADPTMAIDMSGAEPFRYEPDVLYLWEDSASRTPAAIARGDFTFIAAVGVPDQGEQAKQISDRDVTLALQARALAMWDALRSNVSGDEWAYLTATLDPDFVTSYGVRGFAFRITGYRLG